MSVAIPTYNSSRFVLETIKNLKKINAVNEIIIHDDHSSKAEFRRLEIIVRNLNSSNNKEYKLYRNDKNLGGFRNKYLAVSKCNNEIVYQIDSDNITNKSTINLLNADFIENINNNHLYIPGFIYVFKKNYLLSSFKKDTHNKLVDESLVIDKSIIKENLEVNSITPNAIDWVLNLGNWIFNKESYLEKLEEGFSNQKYPLEACSIAGAYFWLKNSGKLELNNKLRHYHRLRGDSYYVTSGEKAKFSVNYFLEELKKI